MWPTLTSLLRIQNWLLKFWDEELVIIVYAILVWVNIISDGVLVWVMY